MVSIYRSPINKNLKKFYELFDAFLNKINNISKNKKLIIIAGDFNININEKDKNCLKYLDLLHSYNFRIINNKEMTCVCNTTATYVIVNSSEIDIQTYTKFTNLSDHKYSMAIVPIKVKIRTERKSITMFQRSFDSESKKEFFHLLLSENWLELLNPC